MVIDVDHRYFSYEPPHYQISLLITVKTLIILFVVVITRFTNFECIFIFQTIFSVLSVLFQVRAYPLNWN
jgi:hypothetical protein